MKSDAFLTKSSQKQKEAENEEKKLYQWPAKKAKASLNMDCFSSIKGQRKLFKCQGIFNFLMSGNDVDREKERKWGFTMTSIFHFSGPTAICR